MVKTRRFRRADCVPTCRPNSKRCACGASRRSRSERFANADELAAALAPIADRHLAPSASLAPSLGRIGSRSSTPTVETIPDLMPTTNSGPVLANPPSVSASTPAPAAPPAPNRSPLILGLVAAAVLLVATAGYLATRDKKDDGAKQDPPPATVPPPGPIVIAKGPEIVTPGGANDKDKFAWPAPTAPTSG